MSVRFEVPIYGLTKLGKKISIGKTYRTIADAHLVGGKIFYIDDTATGATYTFFDSEGDVLTDVRVGDSPYAYTVSGTPSKDKYYVTRASAVTSKTWTYKDGGGNWVYNALGTTDGIGKGKTNTALVIAADEGAYQSYSGTIWNSLKNINDNSVDGCNDWFVPSKAELEALRTARDRDGNALTTLFSNTYIWSSFEHSALLAWTWTYTGQHWYTNAKYGVNALLAARAF